MKAYEKLNKESISNACVRYTLISLDKHGNLFFKACFDVQKGNKIKGHADSIFLNLEDEGGVTDLKEFMHVVGVYTFDDLMHKYVRIAYDEYGELIAIGHILGDDWFFVKKQSLDK